MEATQPKNNNIDDDLQAEGGEKNSSSPHAEIANNTENQSQSSDSDASFFSSLDEAISYFAGVDSHKDNWFQSDELPAKHRQLYEKLLTKVVAHLPSQYLRPLRVFFPHLANNVEEKDRSKKSYLPPSPSVCFNAFKYDGNDEILGVIALAVTQHATVRKNSAFWHDKGGEGGLEWYKYDEDEERELRDDPAAPDYRHTLGIEPKTWLSRIYQEVMTLDFEYKKLQLKPDKEGNPVLANHVQIIYHQVRSSLFFCSSMAEVSTVLYMEIHRRLGC
jgi:hypothetical protein